MNWKVKIYYKPNFSDWDKKDSVIYREKQWLKTHLSMRGYETNFHNDKIISGIEEFILEFIFFDKILEVSIKSKDYNKKRLPPIVLLIGDFFKLKLGTTWIYLETLNKDSIISIENSKREIDPLKIIERVKYINPYKDELTKPTLEHHSMIGTFNLHICSGEKNEYNDIINFWISYISWVTLDEFEYDSSAISSLKKNPQYLPEAYGYCIPIKLEKLENEINRIKSKVHWFHKSKIHQSYSMIDYGFERITILFDLNEKYLVYHFWMDY